MPKAITTHTPYAGDDTFWSDPDIIARERAKDGGKPGARYPHGKLGSVPGGGAGGNQGKAKNRALTPGGPSGS